MLKVWFGLALLAAQPGQATPAPPQAEPPTLSVEAVAITAGPYGEMWDLRLSPDGSVELKVQYMLTSPGSVQGRFNPSKARVEAVRAAIARERFMELPSEISPEMVAFHEPDLRLTVTTGDRSKTVRLYSPDEMPKDQRVRRFLAVWKAVFENVAIRPSW